MSVKNEQKVETKVVEVELLTREAFAPFGEVLTIDGLDRLDINIYDEIDVHRAGIFESDQPVEFLLNRLRLREFRVIFLERHMELTQTFIPIANEPFIFAVAKPDAKIVDGVPAIEDVHAFFVPGNTGLNIHRGTWHEPPFPLTNNSVVLTTSHQSLTQGLETNLDETSEISQLDVEKRNITDRAGYILKLQIP